MAPKNWTIVLGARAGTFGRTRASTSSGTARSSYQSRLCLRGRIAAYDQPGLEFIRTLTVFEFLDISARNDRIVEQAETRLEPASEPVLPGHLLELATGHASCVAASGP